MINYREIIIYEEIRVQNSYLETGRIKYLNYYEEILNLEVRLGMIDSDERNRRLSILLDI